MYSSDAIFRYKTNQDIGIFTTCYAPIRIGIVVKLQKNDHVTFVEKLILLSSKGRSMFVAVPANNAFDRSNKSEQTKTNLFLVAWYAVTNCDLTKTQTLSLFPMKLVLNRL